MPPPRKALTPPCIVALAGPAVKQVETSLQRRLPQSRVKLQALECLVADAQKNRVPRLPVDIDLGVEQGVPDAVLVGGAIAMDAVAAVARLRAGEVAPDLAHRFAGETDAAQLRYRRAHALDELDGAQAQRFAARLHHRARLEITQQHLPGHGPLEQAGQGDGDLAHQVARPGRAEAFRLVELVVRADMEIGRAHVRTPVTLQSRIPS